jgi:hypothetical protein
MPLPNTEQITVRVSDKMLYIGGTTAYPLAGVVRVQWQRYAPNTGWAIRAVLFNLTIFGPLIFVAHGLANPDGPFAGISGFLGLLEFTLVVGCIVRCWEPFRILREAAHDYYTLSIDTAGSVGTTLGNPDAQLLEKIANMIVEAIDDPAADWQIPVVNYHIGDNITQSGLGSIGKVTE